MSRRHQAFVMVLAWAGVLIMLAIAWVQSPFTGPGPMFVVWSVPAAGLTIGTLVWLDRLEVRHVPRGPRVRVGIVALWLVAAWLVVSGIGSEMALDGRIMRAPTFRSMGIVLEWLPGTFGLLLSVAGLATALEARYRVTHGDVKEVGEGTSS